MIARLLREPSKNGATLGAWYVDGVFQCWNLEDVVREPTTRPLIMDAVETASWVAGWKVAGQTAIPAGRYKLGYTRSDRFSRLRSIEVGHAVDVYTIELLNVPGFAGIRVHAGNRSSDTEGCQIAGLARGDAVVLNSRPAVAQLEALLVPSIHKGEVWLTIENPRLEDAQAA